MAVKRVEIEAIQKRLDQLEDTVDNLVISNSKEEIEEDPIFIYHGEYDQPLPDFSDITNLIIPVSIVCLIIVVGVGIIMGLT